MNFLSYVSSANRRKEDLIESALNLSVSTLEELETLKAQEVQELIVIPKSGTRINPRSLAVESWDFTKNNYLRLTIDGNLRYIYGPHTGAKSETEIEVVQRTFLKDTPGENPGVETIADSMLQTSIKAFDIGFNREITDMASAGDKLRGELMRRMGLSPIVSRDGLNDLRKAFDKMLGRTVHLFGYFSELERNTGRSAPPEDYTPDDGRVDRFLVTPGHSWEQQGMQEKAIQQGFQEFRRVAVGDDRSCPDCVAYDAMGWMPVGVGNLPAPGEGCRCRDRCRCFLEFRDAV